MIKTGPVNVLQGKLCLKQAGLSALGSMDYTVFVDLSAKFGDFKHEALPE